MSKILKGLVEFFTCREGPPEQQFGRFKARLTTILSVALLFVVIAIVAIITGDRTTENLKPVGKALDGLGTFATAIQNSLPAPTAGQQPPTAPAPIFESKFVEIKSCPSDMVLVEGDYCEGVTHTCLESKPGNGCIKFKPDVATCLGTVTHLTYCIDKYEWPNKPGVRPSVNQSWKGAKTQCEAIGKRLLNDDEWTLACEGPERRPYPYGWERDSAACNHNNRWMQWNDSALLSKNPATVAAEVARLNKSVPSGSMERCVSTYGVWDMTGNVDEYVVNHTGDGKPFISYMKGGHWIAGVRNRCRPATENHPPGDDVKGRMYQAGFRCGANVTVTMVRKK